MVSFTGCGKSTLNKSESSNIKVLDSQSKQTLEASKKLDTPKQPETPVAEQVTSAGTSNIVTYEDQVSMETTIKAFGEAMKKGDFETAFSYCSTDLSTHFNSIRSGEAEASTLDLIIKNNLSCEIVSVKGYIPPELTKDDKPNYDVTKATPTTHFIVTFNYINGDGKKYTSGYYVSGTKIAGKWYIDGFGTGL